MKYFTPELLEQFRSKDDQEAETASEEWEKRAEAYAAYLRSVHSQLPGPLGQLLDNYYLHDAKIVFAGTVDREFRVTLKLDTPPHDSLLLAYELVDDLEVVPHQASPIRAVPVEWLYDELEVQPDKAQFQHSILLANGLELRINFRDFSFARAPNQQVLVSGTCTYGVPQVA